MSVVRNTVVALIVIITTSTGAVAGYFVGMTHENRRLNELLRETHTQLTGVIQNDETAASEAVKYRQQGADGLLTAFTRNQDGGAAAAAQ